MSHPDPTKEYSENEIGTIEIKEIHDGIVTIEVEKWEKSWISNIDNLIKFLTHK